MKVVILFVSDPCNYGNNKDAWTPFGDFCYRLIKSGKTTFHKARDECIRLDREMHSSLSSIHNVEEQEFHTGKIT